MIGSLEMAAALLLAGAGAAKLRTPGPAATMLRRAWPGLPVAPATVRLGVRGAGVAEIGAGAAATVTGDRVSAVLLGVCYLLFTAVAVRLVRRARHTSCGCFGRADSPVGAAHLALNAACVGIAATAAVRAPGSFGGLFDGATMAGVVGLGQVALLAYLGFLSVTELPSLTAARRELLEAR